ncbi:hypothetical protein O181_107294 [Austropuccinia psidii MF-1]|uniref:Uncharacterized protein n=1 Tax=Austropuccinia psidii MF-1 TaxID=1389203 RepID=A0A9Q3JTR7_9BASI|nr:hypothetical protein [Austropuccinia psidii MF-1]
MSPVHLRNLEIPRNQPEDREGFSRTRGPGRGELEHSGGWFNLESHWAELGASCQKICLKEIDFKYLMVFLKGWNPTRKLRLLEQRETRMRENKATIKAIEEQLTQTGRTQIPFSSQEVGQTRSPVASHHSGTNRSVAKGHHSSQSQVVSRRRQGYNGKNKASFNQKKR